MVCAPVRRDNPRALARRLSVCTGAQIMLYLTCSMVSSVDLAQYCTTIHGYQIFSTRVSCAKDLVSVDCGTICII